MIYVNIFNITADKKSIQVSLETTVDRTITSVRLWTNKTYKKELEAVDFSFKLAQINNKEVFIINASELGLTEFQGIYFLEILSDAPTHECSTCPSIGNAVTANLSPIKECILDKILSLSVCSDDILNNKGCNDNPGIQAMNIQLLLDSLCIALELGYYMEAVDIYNTIPKLCSLSDSCPTCNTCDSCTSLGESTIYTGLGYGTLGNTLILS